MKTNIVYIISNIDKAITFEWIAEELDSTKFNLSFILLTHKVSFLEEYLVKRNFKVYRIKYKSKRDIPLSIIKIGLYLIRNKIEIVHTHLFDANIAGLVASWICRIKKRIYTRHHSNFHLLYFPKAVKWDKFCNFLATDIIAISENVKKILIQFEKAEPEKIAKIHHGFKLCDFITVPKQHVEELKTKYITKDFFPVVGVISRYTEWKGVQYIIPAFKKLLVDYPNAKLLLANANGNYKEQIEKLLEDLPSVNYIQIPFENNLFALYRLFDVFVHVPIDKYTEAFGQVYIEAAASSVPSVFTISGIAADFVENGNNAMVVDYKDSNAIYIALKEILSNDELRNKLTKNALEEVRKTFSLDKMISKLETLYLR